MAANPGWQEWDDRFASHVLAKRNWQIIAAGALLLNLILGTGLVRLSSTTRVVPYVFEVDNLGNHLPGVQLSPALLPNVTANMERAELTAFIRDARAVSSDPAVQTQWLSDLHAHARGAADKFLDDYLHANNPFKLAQHQTVSVHVDSILQISPRSYQVRWTEQTQDLVGNPSGDPARWEAILQTEMQPSASGDALVVNPLGLHITDITWTQSQA
jgi:type IV secretion system protein TrbF